MYRSIILFSLLINFAFANGQGAFSDKGSGHYWTKKGEKVEGEFKISYKTHLVGGTIVKHYRNGKKVGRVDLANLQSLILNRDSFIMGNNFTVGAWGANYSSDLLMVEDTGPINLYIHCRKVKDSNSGYGTSYGNPISTSSLVCEFVVRENNSKSFYGISTKSQFERYFIPLIENDEKLKAKILALKKRDWLDMVPSFIREYNGRH